MDPIQLVQQQALLNNSWSAAQAQKQMEFQERLSNTAHQREVEDLKAAGLNPVLSAHSNGASTPSGAAGTVDTSITGALIEAMKEFGVGLGSGVTGNSAASNGNPKPNHDRVDQILEGVEDVVNSLPTKYRWIGKAALAVVNYANDSGVFSEDSINSAKSWISAKAEEEAARQQQGKNNRRDFYQTRKEEAAIERGKRNYTIAKAKNAIINWSHNVSSAMTNVARNH